MLTYKLHFIRHAQTKGNLEGRYVGRTDLPICEAGFEELDELKRQYEYPRVQAVYTSPLQRCRQTALALYPENTLTVVEDLQELNFGEFEGKRVDELKEQEVFEQWLKNSQQCAPPGGESGEEFAARLARALNQIFADMLKNHITSAAVVTHGGVIMTLLTLFGLPQEEMGRWVSENGRGYTVLMTPQMWMRDNKFEVFDLVPSGMSPAPLEERDWLWNEEGE